MYLDNGREIYESDKYPGYYIDANTGAFCDENGNYVGGNQDSGDAPGRRYCYSDNEIVFLTKSGKQYYPAGTKSATIPITIAEAKKLGYRPSTGYNKFKIKQVKRGSCRYPYK